MGKKSKKQTFQIQDFVQKQDLEEPITMEDIDIEEQVEMAESVEEQQLNSEDEAELKAYMESQKVHYYKNETEALKSRLQDITTDQEWIDTTTIMSPFTPVDVHDDLKREVAFYEQALHAAQKGKEMYKKLGIPFTRPDDYFAEMLKSDEHMEKVRMGLVEQEKQLRLSEQAKKQRENKKFGKKVQIEKVQERQKQKREQLNKIKELRKKGVGEVDDFDIDVEHVLLVNQDTSDQKKTNFKRAGKNQKYGFGGAKRHSKSNTRESTNDISSFSMKKMKAAANSKVGKKGGKKAGGRRGKK